MESVINKEMRILRISFGNFKSYLNSEIAGLNVHSNIFLGENGHGKSNLQLALLFVFSDLCSQETPQKKRECLHVLSAHDRRRWAWSRRSMWRWRWTTVAGDWPL